MKYLSIITAAGLFFFFGACNPDGEDRATTTTNSGGENAVDITKVPHFDSSVLAKDSAGVTGDTSNLQNSLQR